MLPIVIINDILLNYSNIDKIYQINKYFNNKFNQNVYYNVIILQRFCLNYSLPTIFNSNIDIFSTNINIEIAFKKRFWIRKYPKDYIKPTIKLSIKKLKKISNQFTLNNLSELLNTKNKNDNYFINKYVSILTLDELEYVGW